MNNFVKAAKDLENFENNMTYTANGAVARSTTNSALLDLYGTIGAMRSRNEAEITSAVEAAWDEDPLTTLKMIFYTRNVRGGLGERDVARVCLKWLANNHPQTMITNFANVIKFGRVDDLYTFVGTKIEGYMWAFLKALVIQDIDNARQGKPMSLTAKWLKSVNASSEKTRELGRKTAKAFGLTPADYRRMLSHMRKNLNVVEQKMSAGAWDTIEYPKVPANAMRKYRHAFRKHNPKLFEQYLEKVSRGEMKINASTLYPYDLVKPYIEKIYSDWSGTQEVDEDKVLEAQWNSQPNYVEKGGNVMVMADVSGSMTCDAYRPIAASIGLAIYFAQRNTGAFKNLYMTFTNEPHYISIDEGSSLRDNVSKVMKTGVGYSTNLQKGFRRILQTAVDNRIPQEEMPKALVVISDMEIDAYCRGVRLDFVSQMEREFQAKGYEMPNLVLWNVESKHNVFHASKDNFKVQFASGSSASTFKGIMESIGMSAYEAMMKVLNDTMYDSVVL